MRRVGVFHVSYIYCLLKCLIHCEALGYVRNCSEGYNLYTCRSVLISIEYLVSFN